jgi:Tol biopolymer transport system component
VFATYTPTGTMVALYQASADGSGAREILRSTQGSSISCAYWASDSEHLIYRIIRAGMSNIWALPVHTSFLHRNSQPMQLTTGPLSYDVAVPSRDGNRVFAIGRRNRGELVRFDMQTKQFVPFMGGISAIDPTFSRDGQWVAYTLSADHTLWRSRADGTQRLQLTFPPMEVSFPAISPDGKNVQFVTPDSESYVVSLDGGSPRKVDLNTANSTCTSPTENAIVFTEVTFATSPGKTAFNLKVLDPQSGTICQVPSSQGIFGGIWIGQGKLVAAKEDSSKLLMFDFNSGHWTELVSGSFANWMPSPDGRYLYYATRGDDPQAMRIRLADRHVETITSLKNLHRVVDNVDGTTQIGVAPDGSPIFTRDLGTQEIYALTVKWR